MSYAALIRCAPPPQLPQLRRVALPPPPGLLRAGPLIPSSRSAIFSQRARQDSEIPKSRAIWATDASPLRATAITSRRNSGGNGLGRMLILPARPQPHRQGVNRTGGSPDRRGSTVPEIAVTIANELGLDPSAARHSAG